MINPKYCQMMARYNAWMNDKIYSVCFELSDKQRKHNCQLFFDSIHGTLNHLLYGDKAWLSRFIDNPDGIPSLNRELHSDFEKLRSSRKALDAEIISWASTVTEEWLSKPFTFTSKVDGKERNRPCGLLVTHMFNHGTHHRGQITTALSQLGIDYGTTDLPFMPYE